LLFLKLAELLLHRLQLLLPEELPELLAEALLLHWQSC
jgi:hypothetical protein